MGWYSAFLPLAGNEVHAIFLQLAIALVVVGVFHALVSFRTSFQPGKRLGASLAAFLCFLQWVISALAVYWYSPRLFVAVWDDPVGFMVVVSLLVSTVTLFVGRKLLVALFVPQGSNRSFHSLVPVFSSEQRRVIAVHEAGHLLAHSSVRKDALPHMKAKIGCGLRGVGGYVVSFSTASDSKIPSADFLHWEALMVLAGDYATDIVLNKRYTGAESDMQRWWKLATRILVSGLGVAPWPRGQCHESQSMKLEVMAMQLKDHREKIVQFLTCNRDLLIRVASDLERKGVLDDKQCRFYLSKAVAADCLPEITKDHIGHHRRKMKIK